MMLHLTLGVICVFLASVVGVGLVKTTELDCSVVFVTGCFTMGVLDCPQAVSVRMVRVSKNVRVGCMCGGCGIRCCFATKFVLAPLGSPGDAFVVSCPILSS